MNWNAEQLRMLRAMGHEVLVRAGTADALLVDAMTGAGAGAAPSGPSARSTIESPVRATADTASFAALHQALRRAAGDRDVSGLMVDLERLRRDPLLKRALWPQLRTLRRSH